MSLGLCCQWLDVRKKRNGELVFENIIKEKSLQLGRFKAGKYTIKNIVSTYHNNVERHIELIPRLVENNIRVFRLTSNMLPLFEFNRELVERDELLQEKFKNLGRLFLQNNIRVTSHPGQFCVLNSSEDRVIKNSIQELEYHAWMFDLMELSRSPYYAINIHGGKRGNAEKLVETINGRLPENVRSRLTLENDERCFSVKQLLKVNQETNIPVVFDSHHHVFNDDNIEMTDAFFLSCETWENIGIKPLQHVSNTERGSEDGTFTERRKHSQNIHYIPEPQLTAVKQDLIDLEVEAKAKNIALLRMRKEFGIPK